MYGIPVNLKPLSESFGMLSGVSLTIESGAPLRIAKFVPVCKALGQ
jgi:hypothetical protein